MAAPCRHESVAARLLGLRVRIPSGSCMSDSYEYCVLPRGDLCDGSIARSEELIE